MCPLVSAPLCCRAISSIGACQLTTLFDRMCSLGPDTSPSCALGKPFEVMLPHKPIEAKAMDLMRSTKSSIVERVAELSENSNSELRDMLRNVGLPWSRKGRGLTKQEMIAVLVSHGVENEGGKVSDVAETKSAEQGTLRHKFMEIVAAGTCSDLSQIEGAQEIDAAVGAASDLDCGEPGSYINLSSVVGGAASNLDWKVQSLAARALQAMLSVRYQGKTHQVDQGADSLLIRVPKRVEDSVKSAPRLYSTFEKVKVPGIDNEGAGEELKLYLDGLITVSMSSKSVKGSRGSGAVVAFGKKKGAHSVGPRRLLGLDSHLFPRPVPRPGHREVTFVQCVPSATSA